MAKRSQKRLPRKGRDQAGCMWGFISMFDFRTGGRTTKRLLSDKRRMSVQAFVAAHSSSQNISPDFHENISDCEEVRVPMIDTAKSSVKELMEEEMFNDQGPTNKSNVSEMGLDQIDSEQGDDSKTSKQKPSDILDVHKIVEEFAQIYRDDNNPDTVVDEKLVVAIKHHIEERSNDDKNFGEEGKSKDLTDVLRTLSTNKSSFLKLLQDPNSRLVQHVHSLDDSCLKKDQSCGSSSSEDKYVNKHRSFFQRSKSMEIDLVGMEKDSQQTSSKIIILKPGPTIAKSPETDISRNASSQFSFTEIKRKLRHAMGKESPGISRDGLSSKSQNGENLGWSSPNRNHFYTERFALLKKDEEVVTRLKDKNSGVANENLRPGVSDIYIEAKRQISEILNNGQNSDSTTGGSKSLGRILSFSDYNSSSCCSPRDHGNEIFVTAQMRLSPRGVDKNNNGGEILQKNLSPEENLEIKSNKTALANEQECLSDESSSSEIVGFDEIEESKLQGEEKLVDLCSESDSGNTITPDVQNGDTTEIKYEDMTDSELHEQQKMTSRFCSEDESYSIAEASREVDKEEITFEEDLFGDDRTLCPQEMSPPCSVSKEVGDSENVIGKMERPSPISVLEPLFTDDDISPARTISQPVEKDIQPRHIHFEKQSDEATCIRISNEEDEESAFEYVEAVLLGSGLNWDEFLLRWLSLNEILEPSLFEEVELFSSRARHDQKLLFDCANNALKDICEDSFGGFYGVSKKNMKAVPKGMDLINEVWDRIDLRLCRDPQPLSLDQLVKTDMSKHGEWKWMKLQPDIEVIGFEIGEEISDELIEDTLGFLDGYSISKIAVECGEV